MITTAVLKCTCEHVYQDKIYGSKMRLHNLTVRPVRANANQGASVARCTVCSHETSFTAPKEK